MTSTLTTVGHLQKLLTSFILLKKQKKIRLKLLKPKNGALKYLTLSPLRVTHVKEKTNYSNASLNTNPF